MIPQSIAKNLYWLSQRVRGRSDIARRLAWLEDTQWLNAEETKELQFRKLHSIIRHAYATVPYYTHLMRQHGLTPNSFHTIEDLAKLPLLERATLRGSQQSLLSSEADQKTLVTNYSSGSTGARAVFVQDLNFRLWMRAHQLRTYAWCSNWKLGEKFVLLWGSEIYWSMKQIVDKLDNFLTNRREFNTFLLSPQLIDRFVDQLQRFEPVLISTYSNAMHLIARAAQRRNLKLNQLRAIQSTSEPLPPALRQRMSEVMACEIYDKYGSRETNVVAHESPRHQGMCIQSENVVVEIVRADGTHCKPGEIGRVVLTTLNNFSMPLIRYATSDLATLMTGTCISGIGLPRMSAVAGREQDLIVTPRGDSIDSYFFSYLIMQCSQIDWFQVIQTRQDALTIKIYAPNGLSLEMQRSLIERIKHHCDFEFKISLEMLNEIPSFGTGKFRLCVSEVEQPKEPNKRLVA